MQPHILKLNDHKYINVSAISFVSVSDTTKTVHIWFYDNKQMMSLHLEDEIHTFLSYINKIASRLEE